MNNALRLAPMMGYTSAPFRLLIHLLAPKVQLYTEMISVNAVIYNPQPHYFSRFTEEKNTVFQLGGDHPKNSAEVSKQAEQAGFSEININCGCPSNRVQNANFGACLMQQPQQVAEMVQEIQKSVKIPVSVKHRLGIDKINNYEFAYDFVRIIRAAGCEHVIVHARNAWLSGLSPRLNRKVPPLKPEFVYQLKRDFPTLNICINGEVSTLDKILTHLLPIEKSEEDNPPLDAVMIGRKAWDYPYLFAHAEQALFQHQYKEHYPIPSPQQVITLYFQILQSNLHWIKDIWSINTMVRPLTHLFNGASGAKKWRMAVAHSYADLQEAEACLIKLSQNFTEAT